jgi:hypothetical protein
MVSKSFALKHKYQFFEIVCLGDLGRWYGMRLLRRGMVVVSDVPV